LFAGVPDLGYVGFLNADDVLLDLGLAALVRALEAHPEFVAVAGRAHIIAESGAIKGEYPSAPFSRFPVRRRCTICQPATLIRRAAWESAGGLDPSLEMCLDYDLWWRLSSIGPIGFTDAIVAASRDHPATKTRTRREQYFARQCRSCGGSTAACRGTVYISEALERQAGWDTSVRLRSAPASEPACRRLRAYLAERRPGGFPQWQ